MHFLTREKFKPKLLVVAIMAAYALTACNKEASLGQGRDASDQPVTQSAGSDHGLGGTSPSSPGVRQSGAGSFAASIDEYICDGHVRPCVDPVLDAKDEEEAKWLKEHGYPSALEAQTLEEMSLGELRAQAAAGSKPAEVILGKRVALDSSVREGLDILVDAANKGSTYAYYGLSEVYQKSPTLKSEVESVAYLRLAYLLGDSKAGTQIGLRSLSSVESAVSDERATQLYKTMTGGLQPSPRPM